MRRGSTLGSGLALVVLALSALAPAAPALAQSPEPGPVARRPDLTPTGNGEVFRMQLLDIILVYRELGALIENDELEYVTSDAIERLFYVPDSDLDLLSGQIDLAYFHAVSLGLRQDVFQAIAERQAAAGEPPTDSPGLPMPSYGSCGSVRSDADTVRILIIVKEVAEGIQIVANRVCEQDILGENTSLACTVTDLALFAAETAVDQIVFCDPVIDGNEIRANLDRLQHLHADLESLTDDVMAVQNAVNQVQMTVDDVKGTVEDNNARIISLEMQIGTDAGVPMRSVHEKLDDLEAKADTLDIKLNLIGNKQDAIAQAIEELRDLVLALHNGG